MAGRFFGTSDTFAAEVIDAKTDAITARRPPLKSARLEAKPIHAAVRSHMEEYAELAAAVGVKVPDLGIEGFKEFLAENGITVFSLPEVVAYMGKRAAEESKEKSGWEWRPLRAKDHRDNLSFGVAAARKQDQFGQSEVIRPASDYYEGPAESPWRDHMGNIRPYKTAGSSTPYNRTIPLHALRKVALVERGYKGDVAFFVSDYALAPQIQYPDPFLLAVVPNLNVNQGVGRFIIDFWDEPGFGIEKQMQRD